ncbi:hypothetical protein RGR602_PB00459 (plasmid) [Rhizobium gallicum bv. gallicum R602sp]|uniref:Uncharacterized protein n=1 Tax=Rhizobium gallicum bv. gallicum R602sp TaxID=1041138 RepID=A0A0B4XBL4_9HYPH|nr:hypothetical protein RGR602_PB00459 [Rhizobium gallicum bv. gallicum R602sp]
MLTARAALWSEFTKLHREMLRIARADRVCQRLVSAPGVLSGRRAAEVVREEPNNAEFRRTVLPCR